MHGVSLAEDGGVLLVARCQVRIRDTSAREREEVTPRDQREQESIPGQQR
jgi:hypothetical protein